MNESIRVHKLNEGGEIVWHYDGRVLSRTATMVKLEAHFNRTDYVADYHTFRQGDRFVEWFYSDRWYNIFQMHDVDDDRLKGWYCNLTRPARIETDAIYAEDLALDLMVYPDGRRSLCWMRMNSPRWNWMNPNANGHCAHSQA